MNKFLSPPKFLSNIFTVRDRKNLQFIPEAEQREYREIQDEVNRIMAHCESANMDEVERIYMEPREKYAKNPSDEHWAAMRRDGRSRAEIAKQCSELQVRAAEALRAYQAAVVAPKLPPTLRRMAKMLEDQADGAATLQCAINEDAGIPSDAPCEAALALRASAQRLRDQAAAIESDSGAAGSPKSHLGAFMEFPN